MPPSPDPTGVAAAPKPRETICGEQWELVQTTICTPGRGLADISAGCGCFRQLEGGPPLTLRVLTLKKENNPFKQQCMSNLQNPTYFPAIVAEGAMILFPWALKRQAMPVMSATP